MSAYPRYDRHNMGNLPESNQMHLSYKRKTFRGYFSAFSESLEKFERFPKKLNLIA